MLVGHLDQQRTFLDAWRAGRLHHAWLLTGPQGIGKGTFAQAAAAYVLASAAGPAEGVASDRLDVSPEHRIAKLLAAGSHPDFRRLTRLEDEKTGKVKAEIVVDQVRELQPLLHTQPSFSPWRVVIVDAAEEMRREAANAFLKSLEEPPANTLFLLVSHAPGRLLPTIRSRCRILRFQPLAEAEVRTVLERQLSESGEVASLAALAEGSPGRALRFAGLDIVGLTRALSELTQGSPAQRNARALDLAKMLAAKNAQLRYEAFLELAPAFLAQAAQGQQGAPLAKTLSLWEQAHALSAQALPLSLDPQSVTYELANLVAAVEG